MRVRLVDDSGRDRVEEWFAWYPVFVANELVWMEKVYRWHRCTLMGCYSILLTPTEADEVRKALAEMGIG